MAAEIFTTTELELFLGMLVDETSAGRIHYKWNNRNVFWQIASRLQEQTGKNYTYEILEREYDRLDLRYYLWQLALQCKHVRWNPVENKLEVAYEDVWKLLRQDPIYWLVPKQFRDNGERYWWELEAIFGESQPPQPPLAAPTEEDMHVENEEKEVIEISSSDEEN